MLCSCKKPEKVKLRTNLKNQWFSLLLCVFSVLKEIKYLSKIFRPFHEGRFTISHSVNSKPRAQLEGESPPSSLQHSFPAPNCSSENLRESHTEAWKQQRILCPSSHLFLSLLHFFEKGYLCGQAYVHYFLNPKALKYTLSHSVCPGFHYTYCKMVTFLCASPGSQTP